LSIIFDFGDIPEFLGPIFFPGYILGFILGYSGGTFFALVGQLITLFILFLIASLIYAPFGVDE